MNGLLLVNLGTPDAPTTKAVRRYLAEFLGDPRVVDINPVGRWMLLHFIILRFRPAKSAEAYQQIWDERGSPLLYHSEDLTELVRARLGGGWRVELAMRYGQPSIERGVAALAEAGASRIVVLPLFPQYAEATTGSVIAEVERVASQMESEPERHYVRDFYDDPGMVEAFARRGDQVIEELGPDHVLFSFHGLPERQLLRADESGSHCLQSDDCCAQITEVNRGCYRAQCFATARAIARELALPDDGYTVTFQSRLGRIPWIRPYTDEVIDELAAAGTKRLVVFCPAFVADCLETLEEIGLRARDQFLEAGGEELVLVPSLNASEAWADAVVALVEKNAESLAA